MLGPTSRRAFLGSAAGLALTSCQSAQAAAVHGVCAHDCPDACAWIVHTENGRAVSIEADPRHPFTNGTLCPKMDHYLTDYVQHPDRLLYPLKRTGAKGEGRFERISWDQALDEVAARLKTVIAEYGAEAILPYSFAGTEGVVHFGSISSRLFARLGASRLQRSICGSAADSGAEATLGTSAGILPEDAVHSRFILVWGSNPAVTNPHGWRYLLDAKRLGARIVTIDPQRTQTAAESDLHLRPIPGTDAALALGLMHVIVRENLHDAEYVEKHTAGFAELRKRLDEFPPSKVAGITGLAEDAIVSLAREYAAAKPSLIRLLIGMEHRANGAMAFRAVTCLPALTGAWRHRGGGVLHFTGSFFTLNHAAVSMPELESKNVRTINMAQLGRALTDPSMKPPVQALIVYNSNPATIAPNQNLVRKGLQRPELLTVVLEHFLTDTARHADYVFPAATQIEVLDLLTSWGSRYLALNRPAVPPAGESVPNTEFFRRLAARMGLTEKYLFDSDEQIVRAALASDHPYMKGITYERLAADGWAPLNIPEPYVPYANGGFPTKSGKCEFASTSLAERGMDALPAYTPLDRSDAAKFPLMLLTSKSTPHFLNSTHSQLERNSKAEGPPRISVHPRDAGARKIADGDKVRVFNSRGEMTVHARVTEATREGIVWMPHGWWASRLPGGASANALTPDGLSDMGGGGDFHDARVEVARAV